MLLMMQPRLARTWKWAICPNEQMPTAQISRLLDISKPNGECKKKEEKKRITFAVQNFAEYFYYADHRVS